MNAAFVWEREPPGDPPGSAPIPSQAAGRPQGEPMISEGPYFTTRSGCLGAARPSRSAS